MGRNTPRGFDLIRSAIPDLEDLAELAKLRALAKEQWGEDPRHTEVEAPLDRREAELAERARQADLFSGEYEGYDRDAG